MLGKMEGFAIVTGSSRGIGAAMITRCAQDGYDVLINHTTDSSKAAAEEVAEKCKSYGVKAIVVKADISKYDEAVAMVKAGVDAFGDKIAIVVGNAGTKNTLYFDELTYEDYFRVINVNAIGNINVVSAALPYMKSGSGGSIILISSVAGQKGSAKRVDYSASKGCLTGFMKALAQEVGKHNIRVNCIAPGRIMTDMLRATMKEMPEQFAAGVAAQPLQRVAEPEEIADAMWFLSHHPFITGITLAVNGGMYIPT